MKTDAVNHPTSNSSPSLRVFTVRGQPVVLDSDLAALYGVKTRPFNQAIRRNAQRFPPDFVFQLSAEEFDRLISEFMASNASHGGRRKLPWVFTEHGAIMAATVLNSSRAAVMSTYVVRAFVQMRRELQTSSVLEARLATIEETLLSHDVALRDLYAKIKPLLLLPPDPPRKELGFHTLKASPRH